MQISFRFPIYFNLILYIFNFDIILVISIIIIIIIIVIVVIIINWKLYMDHNYFVFIQLIRLNLLFIYLIYLFIIFYSSLLSYSCPPKCYFVVVGGLACLADPRGYASWSFDSW